MKATIIARKDQITSAGNCQLMLRIYFKKKPWKKGLAMSVPLVMFDEKSQRIKRGIKDAEGNDISSDLNMMLQRQRAKAENILRELRLEKGDPSLITRELFTQRWERLGKSHDFIAYMREEVERDYTRRKFGTVTYEKKGLTIIRLASFADGEMMMSEIDRAYIERLDAWMAKLMKNRGFDGSRARERLLKHVSEYHNRAKAQGFALADPWTGFTWPRYNPKQVYLRDNDLKRLVHLFRRKEALHLRMKELAEETGTLYQWNKEHDSALRGVDRMHQTVRLFLVMAFLGLRYSDLEALSWDMIEDDYLCFTPIKTRDTSGKQVIIKLQPIHYELFGAEWGSGKILSCYSNQKLNQYLKEIARVAKISKHLTCHAARHTFATQSLARGVRIEVLKELMGLSNIKTLMKYVHISDRMKDDAMNEAWGNM